MAFDRWGISAHPVKVRNKDPYSYVSHMEMSI